LSDVDASPRKISDAVTPTDDKKEEVKAIINTEISKETKTPDAL
jgi:aspartate/glutamate racemase